MPLQVRFEQLEQEALAVAEVARAMDEDEYAGDALLRRQAHIEPVVDPLVPIDLVPERGPAKRAL
jgi:hypothetical protein